MTKNEIITKFKKDFPTLTKGEDDQVITLSAEEYEATIEKWAEAELENQAKAAKAEAKAEAKAAAEAKLQALGLTTDDLKALGL
jgi:cytochrome c551/c552